MPRYFFARSDMCQRASVISNASAAIGVKQSWKPLKSQFTVLADELDDFFEEVEIEAEVAEKAAAAKARDEGEARAQRRAPYLDHCCLYVSFYGLECAADR